MAGLRWGCLTGAGRYYSRPKREAVKGVVDCGSTVDDDAQWLPASSERQRRARRAVRCCMGTAVSMFWEMKRV